MGEDGVEVGFGCLGGRWFGKELVWICHFDLICDFDFGLRDLRFRVERRR